MFVDVKMKGWDVWSCGERISTVWFDSDMTVDEVATYLNDQGRYDTWIKVRSIDLRPRNTGGQ